MKRLLIIDDEPGIARIIQKVAESCGFDVTLTTDADQFLDRFMEEEPDVIMMDLSMPGMDGVELLRFLATAKCRAHVFIVSGFDLRVLETTGRLGSSLGLKIAGTITKPVRVAELRSALSSVGQEA